MIRLETPHLRVDLVPERGAEIRYLGPPGGPNLLACEEWQAPLRASRSSSYGSSAMDWLSEYRGGWQELFPNAGADCASGDGIPLPFHGEASNAAWDAREEGPAAASLRTPARLPLVLERRMRLDPARPVLLIEETVTNESPLPVDFVWGHHPAFAAVAGALVDLPRCTVKVDAGYDTELVDVRPGAEAAWPVVPGKRGEIDLRTIPERPTERLCYLVDLESGWAALRDPARRLGVALAWDLTAFPHAWFWQEIGGPGFPWFGRARIAAIEPSTAWPADGLAGAVERRQAHRIEGGRRKSAWLTVALFSASDRSVTGVTRNGDIDEGS